MRYITLCLVLLVALFACQQKTVVKRDKVDSTFNNNHKSTVITHHVEIPGTEAEDCIFDTSSYKVTTDLIYAFNPQQKFNWNPNTKIATLFFDNNDSMQLSIGGCDVYVYQAQYFTALERMPDTTFLLEKAAWMAENFFEDDFKEVYTRNIANKTYTTETQEGGIHYHIEPGTDGGNHHYNGIDIMRENNVATVSIIGAID
ncbi:hypothetical protein LX64_00158 [Chitinophaga skermanii]|uniref:Uncharacterized protein n=1 Tax=Chitinophaga skermanii TaxID=331697 RepID=A0A327R450_9BACT|nr:hypothetical protein [Chitinophaga skermanii]RAJ10554.1 hypothetical protein LX64_00158 [Chitinophaga skermanii]